MPGRLGPALGRPDIPNLGYWVYPRLFPGQEPPGYAAPGILGEAWANFGPLGLVLFLLLIAVVWLARPTHNGAGSGAAASGAH